MEPYEMEEKRQAGLDVLIGHRPHCDDCGRLINTRYCLNMGTGYLCWNCVDDRRRDTAEEFDQEGFEWA